MLAFRLSNKFFVAYVNVGRVNVQEDMVALLEIVASCCHVLGCHTENTAEAGVET